MIINLREFGPNPVDLQAGLNGLGWTSKRLADRLGVSANAVSLWMTGQRSVPRYAVEYVRVMLLYKQIAERMAGELEG